MLVNGMNYFISKYFTDKVSNMKEILLIGSYQPNVHLSKFIASMQSTYKIVLRYIISLLTSLPFFCILNNVFHDASIIVISLYITSLFYLKT